MRFFFKNKHPEIFQGKLSKKRYFEGWYFKIVDVTSKSIFAIIPGIALDKRGGTSHAFIQVLDGISAQYNYFEFPLETFWASTTKLEIKIGPNYFSQDQIVLDIQQNGKEISGTIQFSNHIFLPKQKFSPGIMGWMQYVPFMECYHGIVSLNSKLSGKLRINTNNINFTGGKGYIEKDWGKSFPINWIWMQSNHFANENRSFMLSIATVPYLGRKFTGFIAALWNEDQILRFATYTKAKIIELIIEEKKIKTIIQDKKNRIEIQAEKAQNSIVNGTALMKAPINGVMSGKCAESITASIYIKLFSIEKEKQILIFEDIAQNAGLEIMVKADQLKIH